MLAAQIALVPGIPCLHLLVADALISCHLAIILILLLNSSVIIIVIIYHDFIRRLHLLALLGNLCSLWLCSFAVLLLKDGGGAILGLQATRLRHVLLKQVILRLFCIPVSCIGAVLLAHVENLHVPVLLLLILLTL